MGKLKNTLFRFAWIFVRVDNVLKHKDIFIVYKEKTDK